MDFMLNRAKSALSGIIQRQPALAEALQVKFYRQLHGSKVKPPGTRRAIHAGKPLKFAVSPIYWLRFYISELSKSVLVIISQFSELKGLIYR
jgi:hypothetical protein